MNFPSLQLRRFFGPVSVGGRLRVLLLGLVALLLCSYTLSRLISSDGERDQAFYGGVQKTAENLETIGSSQQALAALQAGLIASLGERHGGFDPAQRSAAVDALFTEYSGHIAALRPIDPTAAAQLINVGEELTDISRRALLLAAGPAADSSRTVARFAAVAQPGEKHLRSLQRIQLGVLDSARSAKTAVQRDDLWLAGTATILLTLLVAALALLVSRSVLRPVGKIEAALNRISRGERLTSAPVSGDDEFGRVGKALHELSEVTAHLQTVAYLDALTGLPNRTQLEQDVLHRLAQKQPFSLLFCDIDRFRTINDGYGHAFGDRVLLEAGRRLKALAGDDGSVFRYSGDLFAVLAAASGAGTFAERLREGMNALAEIDERRLPLNSSFGVACFPEDGNEMEHLVSAADAAMYQAKRLGRNNVQLALGEHTAKARTHLELAGDLRAAIGTAQLSPYFQPIIDLAAGKLACVEALARWHHPTRGFVPPDQFIAIAESSGQIDALTNHLLREACTVAARWNAAGTPHKLAFNLSAKQVRTGVVELIDNILKETGLPATLLEIEMTEGALIERPEQAERLLTDLRALGISVALDDFGTGYSSLSYLLRFPIDKIKVDKSFVEKLEGQRQAAKIVAATISLARSLDMQLVAEGVEQMSQMLTLYELGCCQQQGWLFAKALPAAEFDRWILTAPLKLDAVVRAQMELGLAAS